MSSRLCPAFILFFLLLTACSGSQAQQRADLSGDERQSESTPVRPIALESDSFEDLEFLRPLLDGKRVVQLGENTHGLREYNLVKERIVRFLHQELGYEVLALESPIYQCYDAGLTAADTSPTATLTNCAIGVWHTEGVLPLFEYIRESHQSERPLRIAGFDVQPIGRNKAGRPQFLSDAVAEFDAAYAAEVFALDSTFLDVYARGGRERRAYFRQEDGRRMGAAYERLADFLTQPREAAGERDEHVRVAAQTARSMGWYIRKEAALTMRDNTEQRDAGMADNMTFLLDDLYPNEKVIVWGHNFHIRHDNLAIPPDSSSFPNFVARTMGSWLRERYGDSVCTVGLYTYEGQAANNRGGVYDIAPAPAGSLEAYLHDLSTGEALFVDIAEAANAQAPWATAPVTARYNGTTEQSMMLKDQYDAILFVDTVSPRRMLY